jgi:hemin uptake protein HemP
MNKTYTDISNTASDKRTGMLPRLYSKTLFNEAREVVIEHEGEEYRLRLTRQGKLILTK